MRPDLLVFDVNETLSDLRPMGQRFAEVGAPEHLAPTWFAGVLRDGFALTTTGHNPTFADVGRGVLRGLLGGLRASLPADRPEDRFEDLDAAVEHVMAGFQQLPVHPDVIDGVRALRELDLRLVTLSNGSATVAQGLLERHGLTDAFEALLSVEDAPRWKPAPEAYRYALEVCGVPSDRAMLVAVHPWDLHGAHGAGLQTAWIDRSGTPYPGQFTRPDVQVGSLVELASLLRNR